MRLAMDKQMMNEHVPGGDGQSCCVVDDMSRRAEGGSGGEGEFSVVQVPNSVAQCRMSVFRAAMCDGALLLLS